MLRMSLVIAFFVSCMVGMTAQPVPTSYETAQKVGEAKLNALQKKNAREEMHYVVLKKKRFLSQLLKYDNAVYIVDGFYDLEGETVSIPRNSVLVFRRGRITNGILLGNDSKYCVYGGGSIDCHLKGQWEQITPVYAASELGFKQNLPNAAEFNNAKLKDVIKKRLNVFLDGNYYFSFSKPLLLDYQFHLFGGTFSFSKYAFDLTEGGGMYANGVSFYSTRGGRTDDIVCGTRDKHPDITTAPLTFLNCHFSCNRVVSLEFEYANPNQKPFGIPALTVSNCFADRTGKFIVLDAVFKDGVQIKNNIWDGFTSVPIYLVCNHSKRTNPNDASANPWAEEIIAASGVFVIDSNVFIGREVTDCVYYCSALLKANKCRFTNNYIKDIISYSDKNHTSSTAYDAYLSCTDVTYKNNYIEDVMSYSKDGAAKPQCEIGKSKTNPLEAFDVNASREYTDNVFVVDGKRYLAKGADPQSISASVFLNTSPISSYIWDRNAIVFRNARLDGRNSSSRYGAFSFRDNYLECESFNGNLIFPNSAYNQSYFLITGNDFYIEKGDKINLFNQLYNDQHGRFQHGSITISDNSFTNVVPLVYYFTADTVRIQRNKVRNASLNGIAYLNNYSGSKFEASVSVRDMISEFPLSTQNITRGGVRQVFSSFSTGSYSVMFSSVPEKGIEYTYVVGGDHSFRIALFHGETTESIEFLVKKGRVSYSLGGKTDSIRFGITKPVLWSTSDGLVLKFSFIKGNPDRIVTSLTGHNSSDVVLEFIGR